MVALGLDSVKLDVQGWGMEEAPLLILARRDSSGEGSWRGGGQFETTAPTTQRGLEAAVVHAEPLFCRHPRRHGGPTRKAQGVSASRR